MRNTLSLSIFIFSRGIWNCGIKIGIVLPVSTSLHSEAKYSLNTFAFASTFVINFPFSRSGGMLVTFFGNKSIKYRPISFGAV